MSLSRFSSDSELAQRILSSLTPDERGYFIACTDIFHDKQYNINGRPSVSSQLQNTVVLNLTKTVTAASFGLAGSDWDLNVVSLPFITSQHLDSAVDRGATVEQGTPFSTKTIGGVTFSAAYAGTPIDWVTRGQAQMASLNADQAIYPTFTGTATDNLVRPYYQILSIGMEIINATPELYRSGNLIRYRVPTQGRQVPISPFNSAVSPYDSWPNTPRESFRCFPLPPSNAGLASQYPDSIIDEAVYGSYQMHTLQDNVSDFFVAGNERVFFSSPLTAASGTNANALMSSSVFQSGIDYDPPLLRGDFDIVGTYFTGLSSQSVITVRYRIVLSQVPSSSDSYLSSLAKMSPPENPELDMLISRVQNEFLPGIRAGMNPAGEWWKAVVNNLGKVAKSAGKSALKAALNTGIQTTRTAVKQLNPALVAPFDQTVKLLAVPKKKKPSKPNNNNKLKAKQGLSNTGKK